MPHRHREERIGATGRTGIAAAMVAAMVVLTLAGGARSTDHRQVYLQFNVCGNACSGGTLGVVGELVGWINRRRPFAVTLNEVCENQYARLRADLRAYDGRFDATARCRNGARYGNAVLVRAPVDLVGSWELPNPSGDEPRRLMCLSTRTALVVCVVHISNYTGNIATQVSAVAGYVGPLAVDRAVLVGGDFNTNPADPRLDPMYRACDARGGFHEVDASGCGGRSLLNHAADGDVINQGTYRQDKYDYIFLSHGDWISYEADAADANGFSDHDALWATAATR